MENLYKFLKFKNSSDPIQYGFHFRPNGEFLSGGAGFIFSNEAYKRLIPKLSAQKCPNSGVDDFDLTQCLQTLNVTIGYSKDEFGYERFHPRDFEKEFYGPVDRSDYPFYPQYSGKECCSKSWISFHDKNYSHFNDMIRNVNKMLD